MEKLKDQIRDLEESLKEKDAKIKELKEDNLKLRDLIDGKEDLTKDVEGQFIEKSKKYNDALDQIEKLENEKKQLMVDCQRSEKDMKAEKSAFEQDKKILEAKYEKQGEMIKDKDQTIISLKSQIETLEAKIKDLQAKQEDVDVYKNKLKEAENQIEQKKDEIHGKENQVKELNFKIQQIKENHEREINGLKSLHVKELEQVKSSHAQEIKILKKESDLSFIYLKYVDKTFSRTMSKPMGIFMQLDEMGQKWILDLSAESNMIEKRTAERQARSIANSGWLEGGKRLGVKFDLEIRE